mmetsp:Transcript_30628/g.99574  ORF Transcript_30628/g.99574 Transcript_30628/m.99574 type:complete len:549 (-) Transcript_30628:124-1770(-)
MRASLRGALRLAARPQARSQRNRAIAARAVAVETDAAVALVPPKPTGEVRVRFAPSPTGNLHVGGARTALFNWLYARRTGGKFVLRVEDTDTARSTRESEEAMVRDLKWLGLDWDEGPDVGGECGPYRQSERAEIYQQLAKKLVSEGKAYPCFCTDEELETMKEEAAAQGLPPQYTGKWATASAEEVEEMFAKGAPHTYRFRVPPNEVVTIQDEVRGEVSWNTDTLGDFVLLRSNGLPVYNFCVAVDDALMGITHVLRAEEHLPNTLRQMLVYNALGFPVPKFGHMSLILAPDRSKLSKRHGATSVGDFKEQGFLAPAMVNFLSLLGWNDGTEQEVYETEELVRAFSLDRITKSPAVFDKEKLAWMNGEHLHALPKEEQVALIKAAWTQSGLVAADSEASEAFTAAGVDLVITAIDLVNEAEPELLNILAYPLEETAASGKADKIFDDDFEQIVDAVVNAHEAGELQQAVADGDWKGWTKAVGKATGRKGKNLFMPLRVALTGRMQGPDVGQVLSLLAGAEGAVARTEALVPLDERVAQLKGWAEQRK